MIYRIGEVADFFGLTKEGVRYYERKGIIRSQRDENSGYRYFDRKDITRLKQIRAYESLGFSLEDALRVSQESSFDEMQQQLEEKLNELERREFMIAKMKKALKEQKNAALRLKSGIIEVRLIPELAYLRRVPNEASGNTDEERREIARARQDEKSWISAMPDVTLFARHYDCSLCPVEGDFGSMIPHAEAEMLGLPLEYALLLPERLCVCGTVECIDTNHPDVGKLTVWMKEHGFTLCDDIYAARCFAYLDEKRRKHTVHDVFLPI